MCLILRDIISSGKKGGNNNYAQWPRDLIGLAMCQDNNTENGEKRNCNRELFPSKPEKGGRTIGRNPTQRRII